MCGMCEAQKELVSKKWECQGISVEFQQPVSWMVASSYFILEESVPFYPVLTVRPKDDGLWDEWKNKSPFREIGALEIYRYVNEEEREGMTKIQKDKLIFAARNKYDGGKEFPDIVSVTRSGIQFQAAFNSQFKLYNLEEEFKLPKTAEEMILLLGALFGAMDSK